MKGGIFIAIYHCSIKIISRGKGKSAVGATAYRSGQKLTNEYDGLTHDYTRKGGVVHTEILLPEHAPPEYADRSTLWNAVEKVEKARNSQLACEIEISLPNELSRAENIKLARCFVQETFVSKGMCTDICVHDPEREQPNVHAHIMLTLRTFNEDGTWDDKQRKEYIMTSGALSRIRRKRRNIITLTATRSKCSRQLGLCIIKCSMAEKSHRRLGVKSLPNLKAPTAQICSGCIS